MILNIQILRFIAALWVVFLHAKPPVFFGHLMPELPKFLTFIQKTGFIGVDIFFVISGVIMALTTHRTTPSIKSGANFLLTRYARIYSGWWPFFILYLVAFQSMGWLNEEKKLVESFWLIPMGLNHYIIPIVWTLSFELFFYTIIAILLPFKLSTRVKSIASLLIFFAIFIIYSAYQGYYTPDRFGETWPVHQFIFFPLITEFMAGFLLYEWHNKYKPKLAFPWFIGAIIFFLLAFHFQKNYITLHPDGLEGYFYSHWRAFLIGGFSLCLVAAALISKPWLGSAGKFMAMLGDSSYAVYLGHVLIISATTWIMFLLNWPLSIRAVGYALMFFAIIAYSHFHTKWIERPLYNLMIRLIERIFPKTKNKKISEI
ncbi:acyltransferase family protein [Lampropedia aestuarii]|uniref:acyltransferase family protein n=1 Tax=Lampropedia aestuarii TaxID=2562762 RepID=UPI002468355F|nr:acyltransferase [Lampropedia aestuarii]MDH5858364.1 acyltransferase [Lampropedia aestuarii]